MIGGGGTGLAVYNRLQRQNIPFAAGILQENDVEYAAASALAACVFSEKAFFPVSEETFLRAKQMLGSCKTCICALTEFGPYNEKNRQLFEYAKNLAKYVQRYNYIKCHFCLCEILECELYLAI